MSEAKRRQSAAEAMMSLIIDRYGARLTPAQLEEVRQGVEDLEHVTAALRQVPLSNSDEPMAVFVPYRQEGAAHES